MRTGCTASEECLRSRHNAASPWLVRRKSRSRLRPKTANATKRIFMGLGRATLNPAQQAAVDHSQGPLLVLAGAGSGKTRVITHRIVRLLERGTRPEAILAVSFTNRAAAEMAERMSRLVGAEITGKLWLSTFHSFGVKFLSEEKKAASHDGRFVIFDQSDCLGLVRDLLRRARLGEKRLDAPAVHARISLWKNAFRSPSDVPESDLEYDEAARAIYSDYEDALRTMKAFDFDDLVVVPARLLAADPALREKWQGRFRHLLIDEFQDTNRAQLELVQSLTNTLRNICVVGDDDQAIYGWRGADIENIRSFERHFPGTEVVKLEENYRSTQPILEVANAAIGQSPGRKHRKVLRAARGTGNKVRFCASDDAAEEAKLVARELVDLQKAGRGYGEMAVLYRSNLQARLIEEELRVHGVPYQMFGGTQFFDRKEVKDAAAYLRAVANPFDELSLRRVINYPPRGIGLTTVEKIATRARGRGVTFFEALRGVETMEGVATNTKRSAAALLSSLDRARDELNAGASIAETAAELLASVGLKQELLDVEGGTIGAKRWENVQFFLRSLARFETNERQSKAKLETFLQRLTLRSETEEIERGQRVTLSTLHAAKGLEFPIVFLIGVVEGQLPHGRTVDPKVTEAAPTDVEEERRLFYVGVTRAMDRLYVTRPRSKTVRGRTRPLAPSRFLDGLPEDFYEHYERPDKEEVSVGEAADMARAILDQLTTH